MYIGVDVGKSVHPSHLSVFIQGPDGTLVMIYHEFMDHLNYGAQTKHINRVIKHFDVTKGYYDKTRAELEDRGLSKRLRGVSFTKSKKANMALLFERRIDASEDEPGIVLLPDGRMLRQISAVTKDLKSVETSEGHGDVFWSIALAVWAAADGPAMGDLGNVQEMFRNRPPRPARTD